MRRQLAGAPAATLIASLDQLPDLWRDLAERVRAHGGLPAGMEALNSLRLESGSPWFGHDYDDKQIPHEAGLERSHINYEKGCYTGQEIVERVRSRGHVNRRLTELRFFAGEAPAPGTKLLTDGNEIGNVMSTAFSPRLGQPIGLGYASFVVAEGRAFTIEQRRRQEVVAAYDVETGRELWTHGWDGEFVESMGGGVALIDYDRDGWPDIYFTNSQNVEMARTGEKARC